MSSCFPLDYASHDIYFVEFAPTTIDENKFAYVESSKISMEVDHEKMLYVLVILLNSFMMLLKIIMREEYMIVGITITSSFLSMCLKSWSYACFAFLCKFILVPISYLFTKSLCIGSGLDLNVLVIFFMMLSLCFNSYLFVCIIEIIMPS